MVLVGRSNTSTRTSVRVLHLVDQGCSAMYGKGVCHPRTRRNCVKEKCSEFGANDFVTEESPEIINKVNPSYSTQIKLLSFLTLVVEHFFSKMRSRNETPTVLEFVQLLCPTIVEALKQRTACGLHYYTADASYYTVPDDMQLTFTDLPSIPKPSSVCMSRDDQKALRNWRDAFGQQYARSLSGTSLRKITLGHFPSTPTRNRVALHPLSHLKFHVPHQPVPPVVVVVQATTPVQMQILRGYYSLQIQLWWYDRHSFAKSVAPHFFLEK